MSDPVLAGVPALRSYRQKMPDGWFSGHPRLSDALSGISSLRSYQTPVRSQRNKDTMRISTAAHTTPSSRSTLVPTEPTSLSPAPPSLVSSSAELAPPTPSPAQQTAAAAAAEFSSPAAPAAGVSEDPQLEGNISNRFHAAARLVSTANTVTMALLNTTANGTARFNTSLVEGHNSARAAVQVGAVQYSAECRARAQKWADWLAAADQGLLRGGCGGVNGVVHGQNLMVVPAKQLPEYTGEMVSRCWASGPACFQRQLEHPLATHVGAGIAQTEDGQSVYVVCHYLGALPLEQVLALQQERDLTQLGHRAALLEHTPAEHQEEQAADQQAHPTAAAEAVKPRPERLLRWYHGRKAAKPTQEALQGGAAAEQQDAEAAEQPADQEEQEAAGQQEEQHAIEPVAVEDTASEEEEIEELTWEEECALHRESIEKLLSESGRSRSWFPSNTAEQNEDEEQARLALEVTLKEDEIYLQATLSETHEAGGEAAQAHQRASAQLRAAHDLQTHKSRVKELLSEEVVRIPVRVRPAMVRQQWASPEERRMHAKHEMSELRDQLREMQASSRALSQCYVVAICLSCGRDHCEASEREISC
eukprot:TRINITY_DN7980_c0_g1_i3.p1 TRINITY_DN7980_c0_g1~~TRINITY_DN7980_c0_g1_i3.p1  ORF type:complete len:591 (-),score=168.62 TRINITY_DN7980_c0_g1_i3:472-2244(-)